MNISGKQTYYYLIVFVILFPIVSSYGQITFNNIPIDKQLIGRDLSSNLGTVIIDGFVDNSLVTYDSIFTELYRNNTLVNTEYQQLSYNQNIAQFNFNFSIVAELANYSFKIYSKSSNELNLEKEIDSIVAGDAYIIQGQSNAEAPMIEGSSAAYKNDFIRVYSCGTHLPNQLQNDNNWYIGQGDGTRGTSGNTGQWGLKLARMLIDTLNIPIAIFNGGQGGKDIKYYQCPNDYETSLDSNYSRMYYRLKKTGLTEKVRAIFWSQGEWDGSFFSNTTTLEYKNLFLNLRNDWYRDFPNLEKLYIFQTKNGCGGDLNLVKEAQRQLAFDNSDISIMSTAAFTHYEDECHFPFTNGYEMFANRIFPVVMRDLYDSTGTTDIYTPMITYANLINNYTLVVGTDSDKLIINTVAEDFLLTNNSSSEITNIQTNNNEIIFFLSKNPGHDATISYLAQDSGVGNFITNQMGIELVCFYKYPINESAFINELSNYTPIIFPNPASNSITIKLPYLIVNVNITLIDTYGKAIFNKQSNLNNINMELPVAAGIYLLMIEDNHGNLFKEKIVKY